MKWGTIAKLGSAGACVIAVLSLLLYVSTSEDNSLQAAELEPTKDEIIQAAAATVPEYLAFSSAIQAGGVYDVADSKLTEFLADDRDNEANDFDEEDLEFLEALDERSIDNLLDEYDLDEDEVDLSSLEGNDSSEYRELGTIDPGIYVTPVGVTDCSYELIRIMEDGNERVIGSDSVTQGRLIVNINGIEPDRFYSSEGCAEWSVWTSLVTPLNVVSDGDYWGDDLSQGTWEVGTGCIWERVNDFRGAQISDVLSNGNVVEEIVISSEQSGLRVRGCNEPMVLIDEAIPEELAFVDPTFEPVEQRRRIR